MAESPPIQPLVIHSQYVKDLSFENPNAPGVYGTLGNRSPALDISLDVRPLHLNNRTYEILLALRVQASIDEKTAFLVELDYAGVVSVVETASAEQMERLLMIEAPRYFFPFARNMLAAITRDGGFPPLVINPIDFEQFFLKHKKDTLQAAAAAQAPHA